MRRGRIEPVSPGRMNLFSRIIHGLRLYRHASKDPRTPAVAKALPWLSLLYIFWPVDIIPDLLPFLGQMDDLAIIPILFWLALRMIPDHVKRDIHKTVIDVAGSSTHKTTPKETGTAKL